MPLRPRSATVHAAELVLDWNLNPRHAIDKDNLRSIAAAIEAGTELPPIIAEQSTKRVVDGFHRVSAALRLDKEALITVEWRTYPSEDALWLDAVALNAHHGARLTSFDVAHVLAVSDARRVSRQDVAAALAMTVDKVEAIQRRRTAYDPKGRPVQIKRSGRHLAGEHLSERQIEANDKASGWPLTFHCSQIVNALQGDLVDWEHPENLAALKQLARVLEPYLAAHAE